MIIGKKTLVVLLAMIAGLLLCLAPIAWAYGNLLYLTAMPIETVALVPGRNALFLTLMKGRYCLRVEGAKCEDGDSSISVKGCIKTSTFTNAVDNGGHSTSADALCCFTFDCTRNVERVDVVLDVDWPTNGVDEVSAVVFPCK